VAPKPDQEKQAESRARFVSTQDERFAKHQEQMNRTSKRADDDSHAGPPKAVTSDDFRTTKREAK